MQIKHLCDNIQHINTIANWIYDEFVEGIRDGITFEKIRNNFELRKRDSLPISIIALEDEKCLGVASLVENDLKLRDYTPWLGGLYVDKKHRSKGIGKRLIEEVKDIARKQGFEILYLRTEHASKYYEKLGWEFVETLVDEFGLTTSVYKLKLNGGNEHGIKI